VWLVTFVGVAIAQRDVLRAPPRVYPVLVAGVVSAFALPYVADRLLVAEGAAWG
jgi:hypothetical protein